MAGPQTATTSNAGGLEHFDRGGECGNSGQVRAVGARTRRNVGPAVDQKRSAAGLDRAGHRLGAIDQVAFAGRLKFEQHRSDVDTGDCLAELGGEIARFGDRRCDKIEPRRGVLHVGGFRLGHGLRMRPQSGGMAAIVSLAACRGNRQAAYAAWHTSFSQALFTSTGQNVGRAKRHDCHRPFLIEKGRLRMRDLKRWI